MCQLLPAWWAWELFAEGFREGYVLSAPMPFIQSCFLIQTEAGPGLGWGSPFPKCGRAVADMMLGETQ